MNNRGYGAGKHNSVPPTIKSPKQTQVPLVRKCRVGRDKPEKIALKGYRRSNHEVKKNLFKIFLLKNIFEKYFLTEFGI
jgi:hypothetical protein